MLPITAKPAIDETNLNWIWIDEVYRRGRQPIEVKKMLNFPTFHVYPDLSLNFNKFTAQCHLNQILQNWYIKMREIWVFSKQFTI